MKRLSVRLSVRTSVSPVDRQQQLREADLLLTHRAGRRYRRRSAANVGRVTSTATGEAEHRLV